uniref:Cytochrome P450 n=1 Tax=Panagrolaimus superbus TaxID=310955 RepID=A0A914Y2A4_9BILA
MLQGGHRVIVTSDLNIINEVFVKQFHAFQARQLHASAAIDQENGTRLNVFLTQGNRWKRLRALFAASLTISKIKSVDPIMKRANKELIEVLRKHENDVVDVIPMNKGQGLFDGPGSPGPGARERALCVGTGLAWQI